MGNPPLYTEKNDGFTLIELLIAVTIFSVGLLGLAKIQITAIRYERQAYYLTKATMQAQNMLERLKANDGGALTAELAYWNKTNKKLLPGGHGNVDFSAVSTQVIIYWSATSEKPFHFHCDSTNFNCLSLRTKL